MNASMDEKLSGTIQSIMDEHKKQAEKLQLVQDALQKSGDAFTERINGIADQIEEKNTQNLEATKGCVEEELQKAVAQLQEEQAKYSEQVRSIQESLQKSEKNLEEKYNAFLQQVEELNISGIYRNTIEMKNKLSSHTVLIVIMGILSILAALSRLIF